MTTTLCVWVWSVCVCVCVHDSVVVSASASAPVSVCVCAHVCTPVCVCVLEGGGGGGDIAAPRAVLAAGHLTVMGPVWMCVPGLGPGRPCPSGCVLQAVQQPGDERLRVVPHELLHGPWGCERHHSHVPVHGQTGHGVRACWGRGRGACTGTHAGGGCCICISPTSTQGHSSIHWAVLFA